MTEIAEKIKTPSMHVRRVRLCEEWLMSLPRERLVQRMKPGGEGCYRLYPHEKLHLARYCIYPDLRERLQETLRAEEEKRQARAARLEAVRVQKAADDAKAEAEREERLRAARESVRCLKAATHGTVRQAAFDAASLYIHARQPRTIKQCIGYAAHTHEVTWTAVSAYLHGVAFNALYANGGVFSDIAEEADQSEAFTLASEPETPSGDGYWLTVYPGAAE